MTAKSSWAEVLLIGGLLLLTNVGMWLWFKTGVSSPQLATPETLRSVASKLASNGVKGEASRYYGMWLEQSPASPASKAPMAVNLARLLKEEGRFEEALGYLYLAEDWAPESQAAKDAAPMLVEILDRLGLVQSSRSALKSRSALDSAEGDSAEGGPIVAKIGDKTIPLADFEMFLTSLPKELSERLSDDKVREQLLTEFVAQELLYQKALQRSIDKSPDIRKQIERATRQVIVGRLLEEEMQTRVRASEDDVRNFYDAHAESFKGKDGNVMPYDQIKDQVQQAYLMNKFQAISQQLVDEARSVQKIELYPNVLHATPKDKGTAP